MRKNFSLTLCLCIILLSLSALPASASESYASPYRVTPDDPEWKTFQSGQEMVDACRIEREILDAMTTPDLIQAVLDYPLLIHLWASNTYGDEVKQLRTECDALDALLGRPDLSGQLALRIQAEEAEDESAHLPVLRMIQKDYAEIFEDRVVFAGTVEGKTVTVLEQAAEMTSEQVADIARSADGDNIIIRSMVTPEEDEGLLQRIQRFFQQLFS